MIDNTGRFTRRITYSEFKSSLDNWRKEILREYEGSINDIFSTLENKEFLKKRGDFTEEDIGILEKYYSTDNAVNSIIHNSYTLGGKFKDSDFMSELSNFALTGGFNVDNIGEQVIALMCVGYAYNIEYLKRYMLLLINFKEIKKELKKDKYTLNNPKKRTLRQLIEALKKIENLDQNSFLRFINDNGEKRNALAHFSYYYYNSKIWLCLGGPFDPNPISIELSDLMKDSIKLNTLAIAFYLIFTNKYLNDHGTNTR
ncbi:hypothetical protein C5S35_15205 [Candidatus Methanophagaceae archaeon]|nr:hypothetical protein C5S35_15205 [Methanophagales archaeon]